MLSEFEKPDKTTSEEYRRLYEYAQKLEEIICKATENISVAEQILQQEIKTDGF